MHSSVTVSFQVYPKFLKVAMLCPYDIILEPLSYASIGTSLVTNLQFRLQENFQVKDVSIVGSHSCKVSQ